MNSDLHRKDVSETDRFSKAAATTSSTNTDIGLSQSGSSLTQGFSTDSKLSQTDSVRRTSLSSVSGYDENTKYMTSARMRALFHSVHKNVAQISTAMDENMQLVQEVSADDSDLTDIHEEYDIHEMFARGGQGALYKGSDKILKRVVAVKTLHPEFNDSEPKRAAFITEARFNALLDHPSVVPMYALATDPHKGLHMVMKQINGQTLKSYLDQTVTLYRINGVRKFNERKSIQTRLELFLKILDAMAYAHARNVMHRDLKPENIMIGEFREVYIMDWGIARLIHEPGFDPAKWIKPKRIAGTPRFLSPEAIHGKYCDQRADIYALGLILFEVVTLREAYEGDTADEVLARINENQISPIVHRFRYRIPYDLRAIIRKATAYDREERYLSVADFASDLRRFLQGDGISAIRDNVVLKLIRWTRFHPKSTLLITLFALIVAASMTVFTAYRNVKNIQHSELRNRIQWNEYTGTSLTAHKIDRQTARIEQLLLSLTSKMAFYLSTELVVKNQQPAYFWRDLISPKKAPSSLLYSPIYNHLVDFSHLVYKTHDNDPELASTDANNIQSLAQMTQSFLHTILLSAGDENLRDFRQLSILKHHAVNEGFPIHLIQVALENGTLVSFPGIANFTESYDPTNAPWYKAARENEGRPVWSLPYLDMDPKKGFVISCSLPIINAKGTFLGVVSFDMLLSHLLTNLLYDDQLDNYILEKTIVSDDGVLIATTSRQTMRAARRKSLGKENLTYPDLSVLQVVRARRHGSFPVVENGREIIYCFAHIPSVDWFLISKIDMQLMLSELRDFREDDFLYEQHTQHPNTHGELLKKKGFEP